MAKQPSKTVTTETLAEPVETEAPTAQGSRDERHDSIDPATGALSEEAVRLRRERAEGDCGE